MKNILFFIFLLTVMLSKAQFYDSAFYHKRIVSLQTQIDKQAYRNLGIYYDKSIFYPDSNYLERFLLFTIDSTRRKINKWVFVDSNGKRDSLGFSQKAVNNIVVYWKDLFTNPDYAAEFTFIQPLLYRTSGLKTYAITRFPNFYLDSTRVYFNPVIVLQQIDLEVYKAVH